MITFMHGDLLASKAEALVNAVNTVGVMDKRHAEPLVTPRRKIVDGK